MAQETPTTDSNQADQRRRRSIPLMYQAVAVVVLAALVVGFFVYNAMTGEGTARGTAEAFIAALERGDADRAWALMTPSTTPAGVDAAALDHASLGAALAVARPSFPGLTYAGTHNELGVNFLDFNYRAGSSSQRLRLEVEREPARKHLLFLDSWAVHLSPVVVITAVPSASAGLAVDGRPVQVPTDRKIKLALLPLQHRLGLVEGGSLQAPAAELNALAGTPELTVEFKPTLAESAAAKARAAVAEAVQSCAAGLNTTTECYSLGLNYLNGFALAGQPTLSSIDYQPDGTWAARGNLQGIGSYRKYGESADRHRVIAVPFSANLRVTRSSVKVDRVEHIKPFGTVARPAGADDAAAKRAVADSMAACGRATVFLPVDCPQDVYVFSSYINPVWHLQGDPMAGAAVSWDEGTGLLMVSGRYQMTLDYDDTFFGATKHVSENHPGKYTAQLLWDGSKLIVVNIA